MGLTNHKPACQKTNSCRVVFLRINISKQKLFAFVISL